MPRPVARDLPTDSVKGRDFLAAGGGEELGSEGGVLPSGCGAGAGAGTRGGPRVRWRGTGERRAGGLGAGGGAVDSGLEKVRKKYEERAAGKSQGDGGPQFCF